MVTPKRNEEEYEGFKEQTGISIRGRTSLNRRFKESNPKKIHKYSLFKSAYQYVRKEGQSFARKFMNVYEAIPHTITQNVEFALKGKVDQEDFLVEYQNENNQKLRNRMIAEYGSLEEAEHRKQEFIDKLVEEQRNQMEEKMAIQLAIDYLSGMTDRSFNDLAIKTGYMTYEQVFEAKRDMRPSQSVIRNSQALEEDEKKAEQEVQQEKRGQEGPEL